MTDYMGTPVVRPYCPGCEPETDPTRDLVEVRWCVITHPAPSIEGLDDQKVKGGVLPGGSGEAGGEDNRRWCALIHGKPKRRRRRRRRKKKKRKKT